VNRPTASVTAEVLTRSTTSFEELLPAGGRLCWIELELGEPARLQVVDEAGPVTPDGIAVGSRLCEYGGGAAVWLGDLLVFSAREDGSMHILRHGGEPRVIIQDPQLRYGDLGPDPERARVVAVEEDRSAMPPRHRVVTAALDGGRTVLAEGADFYASPRVSPDGRFVAWVEWDVPHMPWDATRLVLAPLAPDGSPGTPRPLRRGPEESVFYPRWADDGTLFFLSDRSGWWNLYERRAPEEGPTRPVGPIDADLGWPGYTQSRCSYDVSDRAVLAVAASGGRQRPILGRGHQAG
jgi:hypothetical protein